MINNFKLKAISKKLNFEKELILVGTHQNKSSFGTIYHNRIKTMHKDMPVYFKYLTFGIDLEEDLNEIMGVCKDEINKLSNLRRIDFCKDHIEYLQDLCHLLFGREFSDMQYDDPGLVRLIIERKIESIVKVTGEDFEKVYKQFIKEFTLDELKDEVKEVEE